MKKIIDKLKIAYFTFVFAFFPLVVSRVAQWYFTIRYKDGKERHQAWYHAQQAKYCHFFMCKCLPGVHVEIINQVQESFERPAIIIANHQSMLDIPAIFMLHPHIVGMAKEALFQNRMFATMTRYKELISNAAPIRTVVTYAKQKMSQGFSFLIYPEGTRSRDLSILPFRDGAFFFAESLKCDIIPVTIWGTGRVLPVSGDIGRGTIVVEVGERKSYDGMNRKQMAEYWHDYFVERFDAIGQRFKQ